MPATLDSRSRIWSKTGWNRFISVFTSTKKRTSGIFTNRRCITVMHFFRTFVDIGTFGRGDWSVTGITDTIKPACRVYAIRIDTWIFGTFINIYKKVFIIKVIKYEVYYKILWCWDTQMYILMSTDNIKWWCIITIFTVGSIISINTIASVTIYLISATSAVLTRAYDGWIHKNDDAIINV